MMYSNLEKDTGAVQVDNLSQNILSDNGGPSASFAWHSLNIRFLTIFSMWIKPFSSQLPK